jgi:ribosomal protein S18 acetylase RimI-like enzyme
VADVAIRPAHPADAAGISALYRDAYRPTGSDERYPFPQFLDVETMRRFVSRPECVCLVAEHEGSIVGAVGALRNIGGLDDRIAEFFGLVVHRSWQRLGVANDLHRGLCEATRTADFRIIETRTAHPWAWRIVRASGLRPLGFEPFAHHMPGGSESMLLLGDVAPNARRSRSRRATLTPGSQALADVVCPIQGLDPPAPDPGGCAGEQIVVPSEPVRIESNDQLGAALSDRWRGNAGHGAGVVGLHRIEGEDVRGQRYRSGYVVGYMANEAIGCARFAWDLLDERIRVLSLASAAPEYRVAFLEAFLRSLDVETDRPPLRVMVVDVRGDDLPLQVALEAACFFPTVYYPGLVHVGPLRVDAVQYTFLGAAEEPTVPVGLDWAEALAVSRAVLRLSADARSARRQPRAT